MNNKDSVKKFNAEDHDGVISKDKKGYRVMNRLRLLDIETNGGLASWEELHNTPSRFKIIEDKTIATGNMIRKLVSFVEYIKVEQKEEEEQANWETTLED